MSDESLSRGSRLDALGVTPEVEGAYIALLHGTEMTVEDPRAPALVAAELAAEVSGTLVPLPITNAFDSWRRRRSVEEFAAQAETSFFADLYQQYAEGARQVTVLRGGEAVGRAAADLQSQARSFIHTLERGPFWGGANVTVGESQADTMARGVAYRTIYQADLLNTPRILDIIRESIALGEEARSYDGVPIRLMIADDSRALLVLPQPLSETEPLLAVEVDGLLVEQPNFVEALTRLFDSFWSHGVPLTMLTPDGVSSDGAASADIIAMLSLGMTDASIARALKVSERTVLRRVSALLEGAGVRTRFQLGLSVARSERTAK